MKRLVLAVLAGWLWTGCAHAGPPKIDRSLVKEPAYRTKAPRYGLLVFGPQGKDRVWLVHDGDTLYVDRNGNGDLTDPGEKVAAEKKPGRDPEEDGYSFEVGELTVCGRTHKRLTVAFVPLHRYAGTSFGKRADVKAALAKDPKALAAAVALDVEVPGLKGGGLGGRLAFQAGLFDLTGVFQFSKRPAEAPAVHLGGRLQVTFYAERATLRAGRSSEWVLVVGTPGVGPGTFAMLAYKGTIPADARPVAELTLPPALAGGPPLKERVVIGDRC
jgi:hypothetical protein